MLGPCLGGTKTCFSASECGKISFLPETTVQEGTSRGKRVKTLLSGQYCLVKADTTWWRTWVRGPANLSIFIEVSGLPVCLTVNDCEINWERRVWSTSYEVCISIRHRRIRRIVFSRILHLWDIHVGCHTLLGFMSREYLSGESTWGLIFLIHLE